MVAIRVSKLNFFKLWRVHGSRSKDLAKEVRMECCVDLDEEEEVDFLAKVRTWSKNFDIRWKKAARNHDRFLKDNKEWMAGDIQIWQSKVAKGRLSGIYVSITSTG